MPTSDEDFTQRPRQAAANRADLIPGTMTPLQQMEALKRVQDQAEQRVQLGLQLFKAAEARTAEQRKLVDELHAERDLLRQEVQEDVAKTLHSYDQWVGQIDEGFTRGLRSLEGKMEKLEDAWTASQQKIQTMLKRSEAMLDQTRVLLERLDVEGEAETAQEYAEGSGGAQAATPGAPAGPGAPVEIPKIAPMIRQMMARSAATLAATPVEVPVDGPAFTPAPGSVSISGNGNERGGEAAALDGQAVFTQAIQRMKASVAQSPGQSTDAA